MKFGLLIPLWLMVLPLLSQNCAEVDVSSVQYFEVSVQGNREIHSYLVPCSKSGGLKFTMPSMALVGYIDPDPSTPAGILLMIMKRDPGKSVLTIDELNDEIYRDVSGKPLYFTDPSELIEISELANVDDTSNELVLMPVMVSNIKGTDPASWFEEDCVKLFRHSAIHLIYNPEKEYEFIHFDEISFINWPMDTSMADFFDFTFTDKDTGEEIPFVMTDNRSFRLQFSKPKGLFNFLIYEKNSGCSWQEQQVNWTLPVVELITDTVPGFQNSNQCVPVRVRNFESVTGFYTTFSWNPDSLAYSGIQNIHPALLPYLEIIPPQSFGDIEKMGFKLPANLDTLTLPDNAVLLEWCGKPLSDPGNTVHLEIDTARDQTGFDILGLEAENSSGNGGIFVQEDREINYDLIQLCNTRDGKHRLTLNILNDEAYPYTYSFNSPLVPDSVIHALPLMIADIPAGEYEFTIRDSFGFERTENFSVKEHIPPDFQMALDFDRINHPSCLNPWDGQIAVTVLPEDQNYQLSLLNDPGEFSGNLVTKLAAGRYVIQAEDSIGCVDTLSYTLRNPREINVTWDGSELVLCPDVRDVVLRVEYMDNIPDPTLEYQLDGGQILSIDDSIVLTKPGEYALQLWNGDGCTLDTMFSVYAGPETLGVWDTTSIQVLLGDTLEFVSSEPVGLTELKWEYNGLSVGDETNIHFIPQESGIFNFRATLYGRCVYTDSLMVQVIKPNQAPPEFEFPNVFSPNGDGVNDFYRIVPTREIKQILRMEIYDRYGNFVFEEDYKDDFDGKSSGWDGRHAGMDAAPGIYVVQIYLSLLDGREKQMGFDVLLIR